MPPVCTCRHTVNSSIRSLAPATHVATDHVNKVHARIFRLQAACFAVSAVVFSIITAGRTLSLAVNDDHQGYMYLLPAVVYPD